MPIARCGMPVAKRTDVMDSIVTLTMNPAIDVSTRVGYVLPDQKLRCQAPKYEPGGGGINVSRAIRKLGGESLAIFPVGGPAGNLLKTLLDAEGVTYTPVRTAEWTRENLNVLEEISGRQFRFLMPGSTLSEPEWQRFLDVLRDFRPQPRYLVASGSLPPGVPVDFYARIALLARESGSRLILDTSGDPLRHAVEKGVYLLKPSLHEFQELTGEKDYDESRLPDLAVTLIDRGHCEVLVVSLGARGVFWMTRTERGRLAAPAVPVRSSVGAGDSMVGGLVLALARGHPLRDAVRYGVAAGAASVMNPGTELCHREDADRLFAQVLPAA